MTGTWRSRAACIGVPIDVFFPPAGGRPATMYDEARAICAACPVVHECLDWVLGFAEQEGFAGGKTAAERRRLQLARGNRGDVFRYLRDVDSPHGTLAGYYLHTRHGESPCPLCVDARSRWMEFDVDHLAARRRRDAVARHRERAANTGDDTPAVDGGGAA